VKVLSQRFRDQPEKPLVRATWWIEWALRNPKPDHMTSPTLQLGFLKSNSYDVLIFVLLAIAAVIYAIRKLFKTLMGCFGMNEKKVEASQSGKKRN
jgi:glucuronosyltransferase